MTRLVLERLATPSLMVSSNHSTLALVLATVAAVSRASCKEPRSSVKARKIGLFSRLSMTSKGSAIVFSFRR